MDKKKLYYWNVLTYNGKCLVLIECRDYNRVVHVYHLSANKWVAMGLVPGWCDANQVFFFSLHGPRSVSSVVRLNEILAALHGIVDGATIPAPESEAETESLRIAWNRMGITILKKRCLES